MKPLRLLMITLLLRACWSVLRGADAPADSLEHWKETVRARFPEVTQLSTTNLARMIQPGTNPPIVLLDVRSPREYAVSHLPGARRVDPDARPAEVDRVLAGHAGQVVVYCSVGWRSSALAQRLRKAGRTNVANLEGSIFAWANEDRPLEADGKPTRKVHPYNKTFGRLLLPELRAEP